MNRWHAFKQLVLVRLREFYREPEVMFWVYGFPLVLALVLGLAFSGGEPADKPLIDLAQAETSLPRGLQEALEQAGVQVEVHSLDDCRQRLRLGKTALYVELVQGEFRCVHDPARDESRSTFHQVDAALLRWQAQQEKRPLPGVKAVKVTEPGSRYIDFLMPGLLGMNLMGGGLFGVGFLIVDMRVRKLLKRLTATPMNRADFLLALFTGRLLMLLPEVLVLLLVAKYGFKVPLGGDPLTVALVLLIAAVAFSSLGLLIACRTDKLETASGLVNLTALPQWLLSGTFFSSKRFPDVMQPFIQALPLTQTNDVLREVMLEGATLPQVAWRLGVLSLWGTICFVLALRWFRWQ